MKKIIEIVPVFVYIIVIVALIAIPFVRSLSGADRKVDPDELVWTHVEFTRDQVAELLGDRLHPELFALEGESDADVTFRLRHLKEYAPEDPDGWLEFEAYTKYGKNKPEFIFMVFFTEDWMGEVRDLISEDLSCTIDGIKVVYDCRYSDEFWAMPIYLRAGFDLGDWYCMYSCSTAGELKDFESQEEAEAFSTMVWLDLEQIMCGLKSE